jgi:hypothetical protein
MVDERGEKAIGDEAKVQKVGGFLGSLKDALLAAGRDEMPSSPARMAAQPISKHTDTPVVPKASPAVIAGTKPASEAITTTPPLLAQSPSAEEAARLARIPPVPPRVDNSAVSAMERDSVPTTRVVRGPKPALPSQVSPDRTQLVRGKKAIERGVFAQDPVVGFLVVVGGPGLGAFRPIFEGNNTVGRADSNRVPLDFGDDAISAEAQAYIRYDSNDRSFLFVPNLAKTNVVSVNDKKPTGAVELKAMDVITLGRTQVAFVPFCGTEFDWSEISET